MTTFLLIRHASHGLLGKILCGRAPEVCLDEAGRAEAVDLAALFRGLPVAALYSSPVQRAVETAAPLAAALDLPMQVSAALDEIDFGKWTGKSFAQLAGEAEWLRWNCSRSQGRAPAGEAMREVQERIVAEMERLTLAHREQIVALISHGDVIKAAVLHCLGLTLDSIHTLDVDPASVSVLTFEEGQSQSVLVNGSGSQLRDLIESLTNS